MSVLSAVARLPESSQSSIADLLIGRLAAVAQQNLSRCDNSHLLYCRTCIFYTFCLSVDCLQCCDAVGWVAGRVSGL